jgi:hypothetical protein
MRQPHRHDQPVELSARMHDAKDTGPPVEPRPLHHPVTRSCEGTLEIGGRWLSSPAPVVGHPDQHGAGTVEDSERRVRRQ